jgi:type I restriction enzyme M protein
MSKNGAPFKIAVVGDMKGKSILANGNLYVIELDESRIRPYYLKAFFESELGTKTLNSIAVGTALPVIQVEALKSVSIPCPPLGEQVELEKKYLKSMDTVRSLKSQLASALEASKNFFKEGD